MEKWREQLLDNGFRTDISYEPKGLGREVRLYHPAMALLMTEPKSQLDITDNYSICSQLYEESTFTERELLIASAFFGLGSDFGSSIAVRREDYRAVKHRKDSTYYKWLPHKEVLEREIAKYVASEGIPGNTKTKAIHAIHKELGQSPSRDTFNKYLERFKRGEQILPSDE